MVHNRIKQLRTDKGITQVEFARAIGIAKNTASQYENGQRTPDLETIKKIAKYFRVSTDYLLGQSDAKNVRIETHTQKKNKLIPVLGVVKAGYPAFAQEDIIDYEELSDEMAQDENEYFALQVEGNSMIPTLSQGDTVIIKRQCTVNNMSIAVVLIGDNATIKRVKQTQDGIMLIPDNNLYEPMFYSNSQIEDEPIRILGKVVELRRRM